MKVEWKKAAQRDIRRYGSNESRARLVERIEMLSHGFDGFDVQRVVGRPGKIYRVRLGDVRVIVERRGESCWVLEVVDRKDAY